MAQVNYYGPESITSTLDAGGDTAGTITLVGAGPGKAQAISDISFHAAATITAFSLLITKNDGTTIISKIGGQVGGAATGPLGPYVFSFRNPIICASGDNAVVKFTVTGATNGTVFGTVNYSIVASG